MHLNAIIQFPPIFNISLQPLATAAREFVCGFRRLNRMHSQKKSRNLKYNAPKIAIASFLPGAYSYF